MKSHPTPSREWILRYVEEQEFGVRELAPEERQTIEEWLDREENSRQEASAMRDHLRVLRRMRKPVAPPDLASRCLEAIQRKRRIRSSLPLTLWKHPWLWAGATAVFLIFLSGIWVGQSVLRPEVQPFVQLVQAQGYYLNRLEGDLAELYNESTLTADNPWYQPIQNLKQTSRALSATFEKNEGDPVIVRGLSLAIAQNINLLKSLCDYMESKKSIPDFDMQSIDTSNALLEDSI